MISPHYLSNTISQLYELHNSLSSAERKKGDKIMNEMGNELLRKWFNENYEEVRKYILSTPAQRTKRKKWNDDFRERFLLIFFSATLIERGKIFLEVIEEYPINQDEKYREMSLKASDIFSEIKSYKSFFNTILEDDFKY